MKTEWDYTNLAKAYLKRPDYSSDAIDELFKMASINKGDQACDVGAGVAHLTLHLLKRGLNVVAVEPNDNMRKYGIQRTTDLKNIKWFEGTGEKTNQSSKSFNIVTFGSSFNVCNQELAMNESVRLLKEKGWIAIMWNHRNLKDPLQESIEEIITTNIPNYDYGNRRADQSDTLQKSNLFTNIETIQGSVIQQQSTTDIIEAWRSHGTLHRQAGNNFHKIIEEIEKLLSKTTPIVDVPYDTRMWVAQVK